MTKTLNWRLELGQKEEKQACLSNLSCSVNDGSTNLEIGVPTFGAGQAFLRQHLALCKYTTTRAIGLRTAQN